ncbi:MAG: nucleotidyl transferase AbiEii/AbiGii toxin family protein, partial [Thermodesulfobacteriota bacterium]|nr:nucleotidyl transferase AbiEii/AbiGii toxin family protein [Thermodesulfobacteriota bacterium]
ASLIFKGGGTCLSKVYSDFNRLSEDLDFVISVPVDTTRSQRRAAIESIKEILEKLPNTVPEVIISKAFEGHNESRQYIGHLEYPSVVIDKHERIKIEVGLREPLLIPAESGTAQTIATNPFSLQPLIPAFTVNAMALREIYAEKFRAALTRREPAIRDFFDLFHAFNKKKLNPHDPGFINMVRTKILVPGNDPVDISIGKRLELDRQLKGQLKPVLRPGDFALFTLDKAFDIVRTMAEAISAQDFE